MYKCVNLSGVFSHSDVTRQLTFLTSEDDDDIQRLSPCLTGNTLRVRYKPNRLMLFRGIIAVYCENHTEHINALCEKDTVFCGVTLGGTYSYHCAFTGTGSLFAPSSACLWAKWQPYVLTECSRNGGLWLASGAGVSIWGMDIATANNRRLHEDPSNSGDTTVIYYFGADFFEVHIYFEVSVLRRFMISLGMF
jgi:hypothetical protein